MLVLTRKVNQSIMIGEDVEISVLAVSRDKIRIGITAPREVPVFRKEVYLSMNGPDASADHNGASADGNGNGNGSGGAAPASGRLAEKGAEKGG